MISVPPIQPSGTHLAGRGGAGGVAEGELTATASAAAMPACTFGRSSSFVSLSEGGAIDSAVLCLSVCGRTSASTGGGGLAPLRCSAVHFGSSPGVRDANCSSAATELFV